MIVLTARLLHGCLSYLTNTPHHPLLKRATEYYNIRFFKAVSQSTSTMDESKESPIYITGIYIIYVG